MSSPYSLYCEKLKKKCAYRSLIKENREMLDFSSNDYLSLSQNSKVIEAGCLALKEWGAGATGSRLLSGNRALFSDFEKEIARDKKTEAALLFSSGYLANCTVLPALLDGKVFGKKPLCFFDRLNHASLYSGLFLSQCDYVRYRHLDMDNLREHLRLHKDDVRPKFIITETLFGMDGDSINPHELLQIAKEENASVYLDEAHATGLFGKQGYGLSTLCNFKEVPHVIMGTLSKAIGASGAYIASSEDICNYLINRSGGFIYSTAPSPMVIAAARCAWQMIPSLTHEREKLFRHADRVRKALKAEGIDTLNSTSQIVPIIIGDEEKTLSLREKLKEDSILVSAVRPPTVPFNTSRLRLAFTCSHTDEDIDHLLRSLKRLL